MSQASKITTIVLAILFVVLYTVGLAFLFSPADKVTSGSATGNSVTDNLSVISDTYDTSSNVSSTQSSDIMSTESSSDVSKVESDNQSSSVNSSSTESDTSSITGSVTSSDSSSTVVTPPKPVNKSFTSAMWCSYGDLNFRKDSSYVTFKAKINKMFDDAVALGNDAVICQVRPFADAYYPSNIFPYSVYLTGTQGKSPGYDPMAYMITAAHSRGLEFHAWINPYRISTAFNDPNKLSDNHIAKVWWNTPEKKRNVLISGNGIYFNPTKEECQKLIIDGVKEIVDNYAVDGIHIDDYFYPTTDLNFDKVEFDQYTASGGTLSQAAWRRDNVNRLVQGLYNAAHSKAGVVFGVSPSYNFETNYNEQYADLKLWMKTEGYLDYIVPQIYFGYEHSFSKAQYTNCLNTWANTEKLEKVKLYIGLGAYKIGYASDGGSDEWNTDNDILAKQTLDAKSKGCDGIFIFNYSALFNNNKNPTVAAQQLQNLKAALNSINN